MDFTLYLKKNINEEINHCDKHHCDIKIKYSIYKQVKSGLLLLLVLFQNDLFPQSLLDTEVKQRDSLKIKLKTDSAYIYRFQKLRPYVNLDQRNSFIKDAPINVNGFQLGILIKEKHVIGTGGYAITANSQQKVKTRTVKNVDVEKELELKYLTLFYQYVAIDRRYLELDLQAEFGLGKFNLKLTDSKTNILLLDKSAGMIVSGIGPILVIKPFKWIGITGMAGYRITFEKNPNLNFSGAYYGYGLWLDIRQIIRNYKYSVKKRNYRKQLK